MKLSILLFVASLINITAAVYPQGSKFNFKMQNASIKEVLNEVEKNSSYRFLYRNEFINVDEKVDITANNEPLDAIMSKLFNSGSIVYKVFEGDLVVITDKSLQQAKVSGKITDSETGDALAGVNVVLKGTQIGAITDLDGKYTIEVTGENPTLEFTFIGYAPQSIVVSNQTVIDVKLATDVKSLDEIVVVGYGVQKRSDVTGSVSSISKDRLTELPVTNILHAMEGSTAGLVITQTSSVPGSSANMQIRGVNSINAGTTPFIVLDGAPFWGATNDINPNDIESIEILKDASAVAIYGTRGANGVILITSKRGKKGTGKPIITYSGNVGVEGIANMLTPMGPEAYVQKYADFNLQNGIPQTTILPNTSEINNYNNGITTDWMDQVTQTGVYSDQNVSIAGSTDHVSYFVSGSHLKQDGVVKGYQYKRTSFRTNIDAKINDYFKVGTSAFISSNNYDGGRVNFLEATAMSPYSVPTDDKGNYIIYPMSPELLFLNPLIGLTQERLDRSLNLSGNGYFEVTPGIKGLKYKLNASYVYNIIRKDTYSGRQFNDNSGTAEAFNSQETSWVVENLLTYEKDFNKHHIDFTGLYSAQQRDYFEDYAKSVSFVNDALSYYDLYAGANKSTDSKGNKRTLVSQMVRLNYTYDSRYLLTVTARRDGSSVFGANTTKYGLFPSFALGWNIANEGFMKSIEQIDQLKLRLSYGTVGNEAIEVNQTATTAGTVQYPFGGKASTGVVFSNLGNADLHWESTESFNAGLDYSILDKRISGAIEVYKTNTSGILLRRNLPTTTGYANVWANLGKMQNVGFEITIKSLNIKGDDFTWATDLNFSKYKNEILELYGDGKDDKGNNWFIGQPLRVVRDYEKLGIWQTGEDASTSDPGSIPGDLKFKDQLTVDTDGDGIKDATDGRITDDDKIITGQRDPKWIAGLTNTFTYKNFNLRIFLQTSQGGLRQNRDLTYADEAWRRNIPADFKYWTAENQDNYWPSLAAYKKYRGFQFAEDYSYVRIKDVTLSYIVPKTFLNKVKIQGLTLFLSGRNLYTFTKWFGWDPEMSYDSRGSANWRNNYPVVRTFSFGINLSL